MTDSFEHLPSSITLITPPSIFLLDERVFVNLGILKVASSLEKAGIKVHHLDLNGFENYQDKLCDHLECVETKVLGITLTTPQLPSVHSIIKTIRQLRPDLKIILGGPHITLTHSAVKMELRKGLSGRAHRAWRALENLGDVLVSGDGELAIFAAIEPNAPKLIDADDPKGGFFMSHQIYDQSPYPARHLVDLSSYRYEIEGQPSTNLIAQLGCPFACGFCGGRNSKSLRQIRTRTTSSIINEIKMLHQTYGYTGFMFYDDELNVNREMVALMNALRALQDSLGVEFRLRGFIKSQLFNVEQARAMYAAGFRWILVGFESGSPRILENINKKASVDDNDRAMEWAHQVGLKVKALMSIGHPGESEKTISQTQQWLITRQPNDFDCTIITTYPGTPYYDEALPNPNHPGVWTYTQNKTGDLLHAYEVNYATTADYYKGDPNDGYKSYVFTDFLTAPELVELRSWTENSVRSALKIAYPLARPAQRFEHSMGQMGPPTNKPIRQDSPGSNLGRSNREAAPQSELSNLVGS